CNELPRGGALFVHLTLMPFIPSAGELKTKPTQHSVKELRSIGIQPDILLVRADREIPESERRKIALFCNVRPSSVIQALDARTIYEVPLAYHAERFDEEVLHAFGITDAPAADLSRWRGVVQRIVNPDGVVRIAVVGKYTALKDAYKSLIEAIAHGGVANNVRVEIEWVDSSLFDKPDAALSDLSDVHGVLVPGGFGERGAEGKIRAAGFAREKKIPFFGICYGMQMAVIEAARSLLGEKNATSSELGPGGLPIVGLLTEWTRGNARETRRAGGDLGGTMRLGAYPATLAPGSRVAEAYGATSIFERHRHRFEVDIAWAERLRAKGVVFSGVSPDGALPEIMEIEDHPWFVGVQFHPELKSRPFDPHPLFAAFVKAAVERSRLV
ncbi:MAG: CTP synthase, partial [Parvularculaceae bacterium]|nr:CTP synthase [Parvularculaceae bacterium]